MTRPRVPSLESLEDRAMPALFGQPWAEPGRLTVSFAPDGTDVVGRASALYRLLDAQLPRAVWQREVLRAFQTWAIHADLNFAVTPDGGLPFGSLGPTQGDPRFGDIRIGTQPMGDEALAITVPPDGFLAGTWAGEMLLNSRVRFTPANLFPIVEHEVGHVLGLPNSADPRSPLFRRLGGEKPLTAGDIAALRALYGRRMPDSWEGVTGNERPATATRLPSDAPTFNGTSPLLVFGDVGSLRDVDTYLLPRPAGYVGAVTIRVQTAGVSLLAPSAVVFDRFGRVLARAAAANATGNVLSLTVPANGPLYIRVTSATRNVFGIGRYALAATFNRSVTTTPPALATLIRQAPAQVDEIDDDDSFRDLAGALLERDDGDDDNSDSGRRLEPFGAAASPSFSATGSVEDDDDVDFFRVRAPRRAEGQVVALAARVTQARLNGTLPRVELLDRHLDPVPFEVLLNGNGTLTIKAVGLEPERDYFVRVSADDDDDDGGNYTFSAQFADAVASPRPFAVGTVEAGQANSYRMFLGQTQVLQLSLTATEAVRFDLRDAAGVLVTSLEVAAGETLTAPTLLLKPGPYSATVTPLGATPSTFRVFGVNLSDPIGPALGNPTLSAQYTAVGNPNQFLYPGDVPWNDPYFWVLIDPNGYLTLPGSPPQSGFALRDGQVLPTRP